jgi:hypothetical protein
MPSTNGHGSESETERVALHLRVSSEEQRERQTIQTQRELDFSHLVVQHTALLGVLRRPLGLLLCVALPGQPRKKSPQKNLGVLEDAL